MLITQKGDFIVYVIGMLIAYLIMVPIAGFFEAWVAHKCGDDTPRRFGFLTLDPMVHVDMLGALFLILPFIGIGWGKQVLVNYQNISGIFKKSLVFLAKPFICMSISLVAMITVLKTFGLNFFDLLMRMVESKTLSVKFLADIFPSIPSAVIVLGVILLMLVFLGVLLAAINIAREFYFWVRVVFFDESPLSVQTDFWSFLIPILLIFLFLRPLQSYIFWGISQVAYMIVHLLGT